MDQETRVASTLRRAREERGLSIEEAAADAGIPLRYARLLEGAAPGSSVGISDELYLVPFFRRYASFLGIVPEEMLADLLGEVETPGPPSPAPSPLVYRSSLAGLWKPLAVVVTVAAAVAIMLRHAPERPVFDDERWTEPSDGAATEQAASAIPPARDGDVDGHGAPADDRAAAAGEPVADGRAAAAGEPAAGDRTDAASAERATNDRTGAAPHGEQAVDDAGGTAPRAGDGEQPADDATIHVLTAGAPGYEGSSAAPNSRQLRITAAEETWVSLGIDQEPRKSVLLQPGETRTWIANGTFTLTVGNAGGVKVALDGRELPPLGKSGQVVRNLRLPEEQPRPSSEG